MLFKQVHWPNSFNAVGSRTLSPPKWVPLYGLSPAFLGGLRTNHRHSLAQGFGTCDGSAGRCECNGLLLWGAERHGSVGLQAGTTPFCGAGSPEQWGWGTLCFPQVVHENALKDTQEEVTAASCT